MYKPFKTSQRGNILIALLFLFLAIGIHSFFLNRGAKTFFIPYHDNILQFVPFQKLLLNMFTNGNFFWSWKVGLGGDLWGMFNYYYTGTPFYWLLFLFKDRNFEHLMELRLYLSILKSFLIMIVMYYYLQNNNRTKISSTIGAMVYGGSIYFINKSLIFDFMTDAMVWLPIAMLGIDRVLTKQKKGLFIFSIFIIVSSNFYFAFITSVFVFIYSSFRYFSFAKDRNIKDFFVSQINLMKHYLTGFLLASVFFIPAAYSFFNTDRYSAKIEIPYFFELNFYKGLFYRLFLPDDPNFIFGYYQLGFPILVFILFFVFASFKDKESKNIFSLFIFMFLIYLIPVSYSFFNGFSSIQTRWYYIFIFIVAVYSAYAYDAFIMSREKHKKMLLFSLILFTIVMALKAKIAGQYLTRYDFYIDLFIYISGFLLFAIFLLKDKMKPKTFHTLILLFLVGNILINNFVYSRIVLYGQFKQSKAQEKTLTEPRFENKEQMDILNEIKNNDPSFYRVDELTFMPNTPMIQNFNGVSLYHSLIPKNQIQFLKKHYNVFQIIDTPVIFERMDSRQYIETALGVKYYLLDKNDSNIPYQSKLIKETASFKVYENENSLPIGFLLNEGIDKKTFAQLNHSQKDQLLLNAAIVDNPERFHLQTLDLNNLKTYPLIQDGIEYQHITINENQYKVDEGGKIIIPIKNIIKAGELIVELNVKPLDPKKGFYLTVNGKKTYKRPEDHMYAYPLQKFVFNLGDKKLPKQVEISITPGNYEITNLDINLNSFENYKQQVSKLKQQSLTTIKYSEESVEGEITAQKDGLLFLSIPYGPGWNIKVDGQTIEAVETNFAFIGVPITKGHHKVELSYVTPYFRFGLSITVITFVLIFVMYIIRRNNRSW